MNNKIKPIKDYGDFLESLTDEQFKFFLMYKHHQMKKHFERPDV